MNSLSLHELSEHIAAALSELSADTCWVRAELASVSTRGGHGYFDLVEKTPSGNIVARQRATCWSNLFPMISAFFREETGTSLQTGMQVLMEVEVTFHSVYGLSLNVLNIDPSYTLGDMARQRQETIRRLQEEGVFDLQRLLALPLLPRRIAVISSENAAGYGDFCQQIRESGYRMDITLFPSIVQGEWAETSVLQALTAIAAQTDVFDAVVIIRGGGASIDLSCFDSYHLSAASAQFPLPILTGIGHTRDISVLDMVAFLSLKTPTAVAAYLIDCFARQDEHIRLLRKRLAQTAERQILIRLHRIELVRQRLELCSPERIYRLGYSLTTVHGKVIRSVNDFNDLHANGTPVILTTHLADGTVTSELVGETARDDEII